METPKKAVEVDRCLTCICSTIVAKKEKLHIFEKSSIDFCEIIKSALNVNVRNFSASEQFICRAQCYQRLTKYKRTLANLKKAKSELEEVYKAPGHRTKRLCKDDAEGDVAKGVDKHVICTSKTRAVIGRFPMARTVSGYENQILKLFALLGNGQTQRVSYLCNLHVCRLLSRRLPLHHDHLYTVSSYGAVHTFSNSLFAF